jgi:hypothetical protein
MKQRYIRGAAVALALAALSISVGCKDATLGPTGSGSVAGVVLDAETSEPLAGVSVTSTPPSNVLVTDAEGRFALEELAAGNYQLTARKLGYKPTTVSLAVHSDRAASATLFLERGDTTPSRVVLTAEVLSFWNTTQGDTTYAEAEYRVRNTGEVRINTYDVNFRITTTKGVRYQQERCQALEVDQSDIRRFRLNIQDAATTDVKVESIWTDPSNASAVD